MMQNTVSKMLMYENVYNGYNLAFKIIGQFNRFTNNIKAELFLLITKLRSTIK